MTTTPPEEDIAREPSFAALSPEGKWHATAGILEADRREEIAGGVVPEHTGEVFFAKRLSVHPSVPDLNGRWWLNWQVSGPNKRADGTPGRYWLRRKIDRDYAVTTYPDATAALFAALIECVAEIQRNAGAAVAQIRVALTGEGGDGSPDVSRFRFTDPAETWRLVTGSPSSLAHAHDRDGNTLRHAHPGGREPHCYYGHPEDPFREETGS